MNLPFGGWPIALFLIVFGAIGLRLCWRALEDPEWVYWADFVPWAFIIAGACTVAGAGLVIMLVYEALLRGGIFR